MKRKRTEELLLSQRGYKVGRCFGKLRVVAPAGNGKWTCKCDCGNTTEIAGKNLHKTGTKSCGCSRNKPRGSKKKSLIGSVYGNWRVINRDKAKRGVSWILICKCGRKKSCSDNRLRANDIPFCKNCQMIGKRFEKLIPISSSSDIKEPDNLICRCDCGNIKTINRYELLRNSVVSCGCHQQSIITTKETMQKRTMAGMVVITRDKVLKERWLCKCHCGNIITISNQVIGRTRSCGCEKRNKHNNKVFGPFKVLEYSHRNKNMDDEYKTRCLFCGKIFFKTIAMIKHKASKNVHCCEWIDREVSLSMQTRYTGMMARCYNKNNPLYKFYGARGVKVCNDWIRSRTIFYEWAFKHGYREDLELDRKDNNKSYYPENCHFVTRSENLRNRNPYGAGKKRIMAQ